MLILKLVQGMFLNKSFFFASIVLLSLNANAQVQGNTTSQRQSPNANTQIGNNNINKSDNRKTYNNKNEINTEFVLSGSLITGNNPFVTINNLAPNIDSIKYAIEIKKKNIRVALSRFLLQGDTLRRRAITDTNFIQLDKDISSWASEVYSYLKDRLDISYATQFSLAFVHVGVSPEETGEENRIIRWRKIYYRLERIDAIITSLY